MALGQGGSKSEEEEGNRGEDDDVWIVIRKNSKNTDLHCKETGFGAILDFDLNNTKEEKLFFKCGLGWVVESIRCKWKLRSTSENFTKVQEGQQQNSPKCKKDNNRLDSKTYQQLEYKLKIDLYYQ